MRLREILYSFVFMEPDRSEFVFSDSAKVRLDPEDHTVKLKADADGEYSTDANLYFKTQLFWPRKGRAWRGFQVDSTTPEDTSLGFKLSDDSSDYYWDGVAWSAAGASDWNTEAEVATNIASYPYRKIRVIVNLVTTDVTATPEFSAIYVGFGARVVFLDEWIHRTLVPQLRDNIRPYAPVPIPIESTTLTIDLDDYEFDTPFEITGVDAVFNHTTDPDHENDIFQSYDAGTKVITLSTTIAAGEVAWVDFFYKPEVAVLTSVDYHELSKVPAITIENLRVEKAIRSGHDNSLINKGDHTAALKYEPPWQCKIKGDLVFSAPRSFDEMALHEETVAYLSENQTITIDATGDRVDWFICEQFYSKDTLTDLNDLRTSTISFELCWLRAWIRPTKGSSSGVYSTSGVVFTGDVDIQI